MIWWYNNNTRIATRSNRLRLCTALSLTALIDVCIHSHSHRTVTKKQFFSVWIWFKVDRREIKVVEVKVKELTSLLQMSLQFNGGFWNVIRRLWKRRRQFLLKRENRVVFAQLHVNLCNFSDAYITNNS